MSLADRIIDQRKRAGLSQEALATKVGVSRQAVSKWESGQSTPDLDRIIALSQARRATTSVRQSKSTLASVGSFGAL